jgi:PAS domain-containing protein
MVFYKKISEQNNIQTTLRNRSEKELRHNEAKFRSVAEKTDAIIFIVRDRQICYVNPAAERLFIKKT